MTEAAQQRYFLHLAYDGTRYHGWQVQPGSITVQEEIERVLEILLRVKVRTTGCGRTDTGVHASEFYLHFDSAIALDVNWLTYKMNHILPPDIAIFRCIEAEPNWHARFGATARTYHYHLHEHKDPFLHGRSVILSYSPDLEQMNAAAEWLLTQEDFASFCKAGGSQHTTICKLTECRWERDDSKIKFTVSADRFLRNMVRSMVGTMLDLGRGKIDLETFKSIVLAKDRKEAGTSAPAEGLFLTKVEYPFL